MEEESEAPAAPKRTAHPVGHTLDTLMTVLLRYVHLVTHGEARSPEDLNRLLAEAGSAFEVGECRAGSAVAPKGAPSSGETDGCSCQGDGIDVAALRALYLDLKQVVVTIVLPTHSSAHVQFVLFYLLGLRPSVVSDFLDHLRGAFEDPSRPLEERKSALAYLGSFLARARFVKFSHVHSTVEILREWCRAYLHSEASAFELAQPAIPRRLKHERNILKMAVLAIKGNCVK